MKKNKYFLLILSFGIFLFFSFTGVANLAQVENKAKIQKAPLDTIVVAYKGKIKEIIDNKCFKCHSKEGVDEEA